MEALLIVVAFGGIVGLVIVVFRRGSTPPPDVSPRPTQKPVPPRRQPTRHPKPSPPPAAPFSAPHAQPAARGRTLRGRAYVVDGDTIRIKKTQIRLFGIDAPEMNHPFGKRAKWAMFELCRNQIVTAEITAIDDHGRTVAKCTLDDGRDLSAELVKQGLALDWPKFSGGIYRALETTDARKKLWLADARQKGRMHVWETFDAQQAQKAPR